MVYKFLINGVVLLRYIGINDVDVSSAVSIGTTRQMPRMTRVALFSVAVAMDILNKYISKNGIYINRDLSRM